MDVSVKHGTSPSTQHCLLESRCLTSMVSFLYTPGPPPPQLLIDLGLGRREADTCHWTPLEGRSCKCGLRGRKCLSVPAALSLKAPCQPQRRLQVSGQPRAISGTWLGMLTAGDAV